ncbi:MAG TPA: hypothetical protein VE404_06875 [Verrucomicrobiae bacterium]|nr:hypothetical protein [Verrucomicrobiae bacterium]
MKSAIHRCGAAAFDDFDEAFERMVEAGVLTWGEIERLERRRPRGWRPCNIGRASVL